MQQEDSNKELNETFHKPENYVKGTSPFAKDVLGALETYMNNLMEGLKTKKPSKTELCKVHTRIVPYIKPLLPLLACESAKDKIVLDFLNKPSDYVTDQGILQKLKKISIPESYAYPDDSHLSEMVDAITSQNTIGVWFMSFVICQDHFGSNEFREKLEGIKKNVQLARDNGLNIVKHVADQKQYAETQETKNKLLVEKMNDQKLDDITTYEAAITALGEKYKAQIDELTKNLLNRSKISKSTQT